MSRISRVSAIKKSRIVPDNIDNIAKKGESQKILFSFEAVEKNEYFNLDGTCQNWAADLFETMKKVFDNQMAEWYYK